MKIVYDESKKQLADAFTHDAVILNHMWKWNKILESIKQVYYWHKLCNLVMIYAWSCVDCQQNKANNQK